MSDTVHTAGVPPADAPLVLGGGVAGIAAAVELASYGLRPVLVEARPYLGGRVRSFIHERTGDEIDNGQHLMMGCYHATFRLLGMLGTRNLVMLQRSLHVEFRDPDGRRDTLSAPSWLPSLLRGLAGMLGLEKLTVRERAGLIRAGMALRIGKPYEDERAAGFLQRHGQSLRVIERLWAPIIIATLNTPPEQASADLLVKVMQLAFLGRGDASSLAFPTTGLSHLFDPAREYIESRGGTVLTGTVALALEDDADGYVVACKDREPLRARRLILALPERALRNVVRSERIASAVLPERPFDYAPIVSLYLWYDRPLDALPAFAALLGTNVQWMFNRRRIDGSTNERYPGLLSCTISAAFEESRAPGEEVAAVADRELRAAFPELGSAVLLDTLVVKEKHATFLATPAAERRRPGSRTRLPGLYRAGDWTNTGLPATIEGAVQSGFKAAAALMED